MLLQRGRLREAGEAAAAALARDGFNLEAFLLLALVAKLDGREDEALRRFREALYVDSSSWLAHYYLAELHAGRGEDEKAARECGLTIRLLRKGRFGEHGLSYFPLAFQAEDFIRVCGYSLERLQASLSLGGGA